MKKILFIPFLILMLTIPMPADAFYMTFLNFTWDGPPLICVMDSDYNRHASAAIKAWQDSIYENFGEGYNFTGTIIKPDTSFEVIDQCRIFIVYVEVEVATFEELEGISGRMMASSNDVYIHVYEGRGIYPSLEAFDISMIRTTMHELGHAFGLGHVMTENMGERIKPWPNTLMWPLSEKNQVAQIDVVTLEGFGYLYHERSWMGNFPIPHEKLTVTFD